jgi:hypothetical protein
VWTLPAVALAEYRDGELVRVPPSVDGERGLDTVEEHPEDLLVPGGPSVAAETRSALGD